ncbi:hypothetical protein V500_06107 [Pseudogymnoascus sp. VKM F-4518 (FW-2643)]|nr:hypothetical protein V500_06107 [Pseudogymnoascus sp. VKM F-4518 (FW-2643)]
MILFPAPLFLYDCSSKYQELENYLTWTAKYLGQPYFKVPWDFHIYSNPKIAPSSVGCFRGTQVRGDYHEDSFLNEGSQKLEPRNNVKTRSEGSSTHVFAAGITEYEFGEIKSRMALFPNTAIENRIKQSLLPIIQKLFPPRGRTSVLILHRASGADVGGAYPELDTGHSMDQLINIVSETLDSSRNNMQPILCGEIDSRGSTLSIGPYWLDLKRIRAEFDNTITARDIDALFLRYAFELGYFHMALGFRSGALDLFSLLGIPTVSIGLRNLIGEDRHNLLAQKIFRRINVKYDLPRHGATAWIRSNYGGFTAESTGDVGVNVLCSPFFLKQAKLPFGVRVPRKKPLNPDAERAERAELPGQFCAFDEWVLKVGVSVACEKYLGSRRSMSRMTPEANDFVINRAYARYCYAADIGKGSDLHPHFAQLKEKEMRALAAHRDMARGSLLQEGSVQRYSVEGYQLEADEMWGVLDGILNGIAK